MTFWNMTGLIFIVALSLNCYFVIMFEQFINQRQGISFLDCKRRCDEEAHCLSSRYLRRFSLCKMYDTFLSKEIKEPGVQVHVKTEITSDIRCDESEQGRECYKTACPVPVVNGAEMSGNLFDVGSKVLFTCRETGKFKMIHCHPDGSWSENTLFCTSQTYAACGYPGILLHGELGTLVALNESHAVLNVSCNTGYTLHFDGDILCDIATGVWSGFENFWCSQLEVSSWTKIYSSPKNLSEFVLSLLKGELGYINTCTTGFYRNGNVFLNWENENVGITKINFTVMSNGVAVAYMVFQGAGTTSTSWFSIENLLQSSWSDLQTSTQVQTFSIKGTENGKRRWFVAQYVSDEDTCNGDIGWFLVTWSKYHVCWDTVSDGKLILYAKNGRASRFVHGEMGNADKFEIWIQN